MNPDLNELYAILREWALAGTPRSYSELSDAYRARTGDVIPYHGGWDHPLGELNNRLAVVGAPALSALVILQGKNEPGGGFWGCAPSVPPRPRTENGRLEVWRRIMDEVFAYDWPLTLPAG